MKTAVASAPTWSVLAATARAPVRERAGLPGVEAVSWAPQQNGETAAVAVAGAAPHAARGDRGARLAADLGAALVEEFLSRYSGAGHPAALRDAAGEWLPRALVRRWREAVEADLRRDPLRPLEINSLAPQVRNRVEA